MHFQHPKMAVILKYHDGGADHNITFASVQLASIVEFLVTGVDFYVSMRTIPGQSWTNPAERLALTLTQPACHSMCLCQAYCIPPPM